MHEMTCDILVICDVRHDIMVMLFIIIIIMVFKIYF
jgi:hypothetical protein